MIGATHRSVVMARPLRVKVGGVRETNTEHQIRDQEVMRANKELAAYFKGRRTEREARAALKTIKAFVRDRERADPKSRRPLPGSEAEAGAGRKKTRRVERQAGPVTRRSKPSHHRARRKVHDQLPDGEATKDVSQPEDVGEPPMDD
jgi:hypothetical protein